MAQLDPDPYDRHKRAARNQSLFREVNEGVETVSRDSNLTFHEFSCECANTECIEGASLTIEEYEHVRRIPTHFLVKPGHVYPEVERVVDTDGGSGRYEVVEKFGEAGKLALELDPRSARPENPEQKRVARPGWGLSGTSLAT